MHVYKWLFANVFANRDTMEQIMFASSYRDQHLENMNMEFAES